MGSNFQSFDQSTLGAFIESSVGQARTSQADLFIGTLLALASGGDLYIFDPLTMDLTVGPIATGESASDVDAEGHVGSYFLVRAGTDVSAWDLYATELWRKTVTGIETPVAYVGSRVFIGTSIDTNSEAWIEARDPDDGSLLDSLKLEDTGGGGLFAGVSGLTSLGGSLFALTTVDISGSDTDIILYKITPSTLTVVNSVNLGNFDTATEDHPNFLTRGLNHVYVSIRSGATYPEHEAYTSALVRASSADFSFSVGPEGLTIDDASNAYSRNTGDFKKVDRRDLTTTTLEDTSVAMSANLQAITLVDGSIPEPPLITAIADDFAFTGLPYTKTPTLVLGDSPITWSLDTSPSGATINSSTGVINWTAAGSSENWVVRATNSYGADTEAWTTTIT